MKKIAVMALALLITTAASAETTALSVKFKGNVTKKNTGSSTFGVTATGTAPFGSVTLQSSTDGKTFKNFTRPFALSATGTATKRVDARTIAKAGTAAYIRAQTYGQNSSPVKSAAVQEK